VGSLLNEGPIKEVAVVRHEDLGPDFLHMGEEPPQERLFVRLVEHLVGQKIWELYDTRNSPYSKS